MPAKIARSAARPPFGLPEMLVAVHTSRLSCREAEKAPIFTPVQESSGESKVNRGDRRLLRQSTWFVRALHETNTEKHSILATLVNPSHPDADYFYLDRGT
jgi:hypothetical protein